MPDSTLQTSSGGASFGQLFTTGFVSAVAAFSASLLYFHYFPPADDKPAPIVIVDMMKLASDVSEAKTSGDASAFATAAHAVEMLKEQGLIVLDARSVVTAPEIYYGRPSGYLAPAAAAKTP